MDSEQRLRALVEECVECGMQELRDDIEDLLSQSLELTPIEKLFRVSLDSIIRHDYWIAVEPQHQIGQFRVDFLITWFDHRLRTNLAHAVVECDGHDFHEKTKKQAARDKERDRTLQIQGYPVLRFTGSEIYKDPRGCASVVIEFLRTRALKRLREVQVV